MAHVQASGAACLEVTVHHWPKSPFQPPLSLSAPPARPVHCTLQRLRCRDRAYSCMCYSAWQVPSVWAAYPSGPLNFS